MQAGGGESNRGAQLVAVVAQARLVDAALIERLFFKDSIGDVPMTRLVADLYASASNPSPVTAPNPFLSTAPFVSLVQQPLKHSCS